MQQDPPETMEQLRQRIGNTIRKHRKEAKFSRAALAEAMGVSGGSIEKWETGKNDVPLVRIIVFCNIVGVNLSVFDTPDPDAEYDL